MSNSLPQHVAALLPRTEAQGHASEGLDTLIPWARLGKLGVDLGRVTADAHHLSQVLELRILVPAQQNTGS